MLTQTAVMMSEAEKANAYDSMMALINAEPPAQSPGEILTYMQDAFEMLGASLYTLSLHVKSLFSYSSPFKPLSLSTAVDMVSQYLDELSSNLSALSSCFET